MDLPAIARFIWSFIPQKDDDALALYKWRMKSFAIGIISTAIACYAASFIPWFKPDYAVASSIISTDGQVTSKFDAVNRRLDETNNKLGVVVDQLKARQIRDTKNDLVDATRYWCRARNSQDRTATPSWAGRVSDLKLDYYHLTGTTWSDLDCNSF